jgi:chromate transporter
MKESETNANTQEAVAIVAGPPIESYWRLFLRFLRFGCLAWGGPVAQIDMIRQELVEEERWVSKAYFKKLLAIYQVLPGPEAHELCVYFGMLAKGKLGGVLAGLGFMLPGFILMFLVSWLYVSLQITQTAAAGFFLGIQAAVIALILRASHRIASHVLSDRPLIVIASCAMLGDLFGTPFWLTLSAAGLAYLVAAQKRFALAACIGILFVIAAFLAIPETTRLKTALQGNQQPQVAQLDATASRSAPVSEAQLFITGLRGGLLTFGGAYTAIPFIQRDAVERGQWMTNPEFLDGIALSGTLPAPLVIFSTFVGYIGGGAMGAFLVTLGMFLPAFCFSLLFHAQLERLIEHSRLREFLEGVTAGVVGIIISTLVTLGIGTLQSVKSVLIFAIALIPLYYWKSKAVLPVVVFSAGALGFLLWMP